MKQFMGGCLFIFGGGLAVVFGILSVYSLFLPPEPSKPPTFVIFFFCLAVGYIGFRIIRAEKAKRKNDEIS
jgi:hypothetical protein